MIPYFIGKQILTPSLAMKGRGLSDLKKKQRESITFAAEQFLKAKYGDDISQYLHMATASWDSKIEKMYPFFPDDEEFLAEWDEFINEEIENGK